MDSTRNIIENRIKSSLSSCLDLELRILCNSGRILRKRQLLEASLNIRRNPWRILRSRQPPRGFLRKSRRILRTLQGFPTEFCRFGLFHQIGHNSGCINQNEIAKHAFEIYERDLQLSCLTKFPIRSAKGSKTTISL
jgi:hypothetical protein